MRIATLQRPRRWNKNRDGFLSLLAMLRELATWERSCRTRDQSGAASLRTRVNGMVSDGACGKVHKARMGWSILLRAEWPGPQSFGPLRTRRGRCEHVVCGRRALH